MSQEGSKDTRFSGIYNDPKFKKLNKRATKVKLDSRFSKNDLEFGHKARVDKYGRKIKNANEKDLKDFDKYYEKDEDNEDEEKTEALKEKEEKEDESSADDDDDVKSELARLDRARGEVPSDYVSSSDDYSSSESEMSESEIDSDEESEVENEATKAEAGDPSATIAVVNLDWDHVKSTDLMITFSGFVPKGGKIRKICIYPSEFGKERMQREEVEGPPRELFQKNKNKNKKSRKPSNDDSDSDVDIHDLYEEGDAEKAVDSKALRQYQLDRLRYYYAVVYCDSIATAQNIYQNCDGTEYESTANIFDLRYVPEGMSFDDDEPRDECDELPKNYKPMQFSTDALQHSNVKLTWDETPADRVEIVKRAFSQREIEEMDFKAYLASDSDESEEEVNDDVKNKLKSLVGDSFGNSTFGDKNSTDMIADDDEGIDMEITFTPGLDESQKVASDEEDKEETTIEKIRRKEKDRRKARKQKLKELKQKGDQEKREKLRSNKKNGPISEEEKAKQAKSKAELELLMMDEDDENKNGINSKAHFNMNEIMRSEKEKGKKSKYQDKHRIVKDTFKPDLNDPRFKEIFEDHDFAIDPSLPEFKQTDAMKKILEERSKRTSTGKRNNKNNKKRNHQEVDENSGKSNSAISNIVNKLKRGNKNKNKKQKQQKA